MMTTIRLHGTLKSLGQKSYTFDIDTVGEAIRSLTIQIPGFDKKIRSGLWQVVVNGKDIISKVDVCIKRKLERIDIMPSLCGSGGNIGQIFIGAALITASFFTAGTSLAFLGPALIGAGVSMVAGGILGLISPPISAPNYESQQVSQNPSFLFDGPRNRAAYGIAVPIVYGQVKVGSITISSQLEVDNTVVA